MKLLIKPILSTLIICITLSNIASANSNDKTMLAASVNGWTIPVQSANIYHHYLTVKRPELSKTEIINNIIENHLISHYALSKYSYNELSGTTKVGFSQKVAIEDQFVNVLKVKFNAKISRSINAHKTGLKRFILKPLTITKTTLQSLLKVDNKLGHGLTDIQEKKIAKTILITYQFPNRSQKNITLRDIYDSTNIQEKIALNRADINKLKGLIERFISTQYILYWVEHRSGLSSLDISTLKHIIEDNRIARQYYLLTGYKSEVHHGNKNLKSVANAVSLNEIKTYYLNHKEDFKTVIKVKARHITLTSQEEADKVHQELKAGLNFSNAITKYSISTDSLQGIQGNLGWIFRADKNRTWLKTLTFTQKTGQFSPPFMSPSKGFDNRIWEIIYVDERIEGYHSLDSETVRYLASKELAKQKIFNDVTRIQKQLESKASIFIHPSFSSQGDVLNLPAIQHEEFDLFHREHNHDHSED